jgi:glutathione S-transferase
MAPFKDDAKAIEGGIREWTQQMSRLDRHLANGTSYVTGNPFTVADIPVGLIANRWFGIEFPKPQLTALEAYYDRLSERPAFMRHGRNGTP